MVLYYELTTKLFCYPSQLNKPPLTTKPSEAQREGTYPRGAAAVGRSPGGGTWAEQPQPRGRAVASAVTRRAGAGAAGAAGAVFALLRAKRRLCLPAAQGAPRTAAAETPPAAWLPGSRAGWQNLSGRCHAMAGTKAPCRFTPHSCLMVVFVAGGPGSSATILSAPPSTSRRPQPLRPRGGTGTPRPGHAATHQG